jgi:hypothetical protein
VLQRLDTVGIAVEDIDETLARLSKRGAELLGSEVVQCEGRVSVVLCPRASGRLICLAEEFG